MIFAKKNVETIVKIHVQLEVKVKINAKKNVETSGDNCKDPRRARGESKHECKENWGYDCKNPLSMSNSWRMKMRRKMWISKVQFFPSKLYFTQIIVRSVHLLRLRMSRQRRQDSC